MERYLAHIRRDGEGKTQEVQTVGEHQRKAAEYAAAALEGVSLGAGAYLAGLVHDTGKYTARFQDYLAKGKGKRGTVNHSFAGVRLLLEHCHGTETGDAAGLTGELLALAAGGHHGLFDCVDDRQKNGLLYRKTKEDIGSREAIEVFFRCCANRKEIEGRFRRACEELTPVLERICAMTHEESKWFDHETAFYCGLLARLLLSAVMEGDRRDTAEFMNGASFPPARDAAARRELWSACLARVEEKLEDLPQASRIDLARREISRQCREAARQPGGVFRLNVPTGGGKTLGALRFALAHAKEHSKERLVFTSPLLSILEQNAAVIRSFVQDDSLILEHHSNLVRPEEDPQRLDHLELLTETWGAPIVITTLVQLLNTLFSGKTTSIRRFHSLCNSVIVIDEVQTVPSKLLSLFSLAVNFLAEICGATVVLCSATQPCMERIEHPLHLPVPDLVPQTAALWEVFRRTELRNAGELSLEETARFALEQLETSDSLLLVCNKKGQAKELYRLLEGSGLDLFQLSAAMCMAHRRAVLDRLRASLDRGNRKTVCVSTQVIEAGVDISFASVIRLGAGMDSVIQAAGRCNRNGEAGQGVLAPVYLVQCQNEDLGKLPDIQLGKRATQELLAEFALHPEAYGGRLDSNEAIEYYYRVLYRMAPREHHDFVWEKGQPSLFSLLSRNDFCEEQQPYCFCQAFRTAGVRFRVFEEDTTDVLVPYGGGEQLILELCSERAKQDPVWLEKLLKRARPYTVSLYQYQLDRLQRTGGLIPLAGGALGLRGHYDGETGFTTEENDLDFLEV